MTLRSCVTIVDAGFEATFNQRQFLKMLAMILPELYLIYTQCESLNVNWAVLPPIIKSISSICRECGYGSINILIEEGILKNVKGRGSILVNLPALYYKNRKEVDKSS